MNWSESLKKGRTLDKDFKLKRANTKIMVDYLSSQKTINTLNKNCVRLGIPYNFKTLTCLIPYQVKDDKYFQENKPYFVIKYQLLRNNQDLLLLGY